MSSDKRYVYGVTAAQPLEMEMDAVCDAGTVTTVACRDHAAVVSDVDTLNPDRTDQNAAAHNDVLRSAMGYDGGRTVVPMRFGMVFENDRALKNVLRNGRRAFTKALRELDGTVELGVKVVGPPDGSVDAAAVADTAEAELAGASVNVSEGDRFSERLLLNRSYLVERSERGAFDDGIDRLREAHPDTTVQYTGPWPPYSFVDIEIGVKQ